jgi:RNA polymerase sigma factor (sigma-70 family)
VLEPDHPERRFVAALCLYSHAVDTGQASLGFYDQEEAERFALSLLMPAKEFVPVAGWSDTDPASSPPPTCNELSRRQRQRSLRSARALDALAGLPERKRTFLPLKVAGYSYEEIAAQLEVSWRTVDRQLGRARAAVRAARDHD